MSAIALDCQVGFRSEQEPSLRPIHFLAFIAGLGVLLALRLSFD